MATFTRTFCVIPLVLFSVSSFVESLNSGEPCPMHQPFRCPDKCIHISHICDQIKDCSNGADEDPSLCASYRKEPFQETVNYFNELLKKYGKDFFQRWFGNKGKNGCAEMGGIGNVVAKLSMSPTVNEFNKEFSLTDDDIAGWRALASAATKPGTSEMESWGLQYDQFEDTKTFFTTLKNSNFW